MRKNRMVLRILLALVLSASMHTTCWASKADELLGQARDKIEAAERARSTVDRKESYEQAIKLLHEVEGDDRYVGTPQGAEAAYKVALVNLDLAKVFAKDRKQQHNYLYAAFESLKRMLNIYDKPREELEKTLSPEEARQVTAIAKQARALKTKTAEELNQLNSKDWKYQILDFFVNLTGRVPSFSYWFAIIVITVIVKIILTPLTHAQLKSMKEMQKVGPLIKEIQAKHKGDQKTIGEKTMALYKEHNINPFASCLPMLLQLPLTLGLYYMMRSYEFEFAKGTFLWIGSSFSHITSFPVPFSLGQLSWVTAKNLAEPDFVILVLYLVSMYFQTKISAVDPSQADQQRMMSIVMPLMFAFILAGFPSAFLLYWLVLNILQTVQQYYILRGGRTEAIATGPAVAPTPTPTPTPSPDAEEDQNPENRPRRRRRRR
jgi:YidC/Oxa1 family membrane protein insertase